MRVLLFLALVMLSACGVDGPPAKPGDTAVEAGAGTTVTVGGRAETGVSKRTRP